MLNILLMKKWQKIAGLIIFFLITLYELLTWANTYVYLKYVVEPTDNDLLIEQSYMYIDGLSLGMWMNLSLAIFLIHMFMAERNEQNLSFAH